MKRYENTVWELCRQIGAPPDGVYASMIRAALRKCEADTIRRCAGELSDAAANYADSEHSDVRMLWLASKTILALLPEDSAQ